MRIVIILGIGLGLAGAACGDRGPAAGSDGAAEDPLTVVASFYPLAEAAERVVGSSVAVTNLTPPGVEPHDLELSPDQVELIATADLVLYAGEGFQPAVEEAVVTIAEGTTVDVLDGLPLIQGLGGDHTHDEGEEPAEEGVDPHVWLDPSLLGDIVSTIEGSLAELSPDRASNFSDNAEAFDAELAALDEEFRTGLATCERRLLVTSHAAFGYLARAYDLEQEAISGLSPEAEPSAQELADITDEIRADGVTTVFTETLVSAALAETLASEADVATAILNPLEGLSQEQADAGADYLSVMRENLDVMRTGLGCR
ncbi:MAG: zinc ABC transporter substrate-binding protein [Actinomycetota bacterium]